MPQVSFDNVRVSPGHLEHFCTQLLQAAGFYEEQARIVAESLVEANLRGIDSHGVARLPHYLARIERPPKRSGLQGGQEAVGSRLPIRVIADRLRITA